MKVHSVNPFTNKTLHKYQAYSKKEIDSAITRASAAIPKWSTNKTLRYKCLNKLKSALSVNGDKLQKLAQEETGKLKPDFEAELFDVIDAIEYYETKYDQIKPDTSLKLNQQGFPKSDLIIDYVPYGVIALIMPWNFPLYSPLMLTIVALVSGNVVLLKASEHSTMFSKEIAELFQTAGFPKGVFQMIPGGEQTGKLLVKSSVNKIFFVGSVEGGKDIIANAGTTPVQVEMGGNSAALVLKDADLDVAANGIAWGGTYHSGQDCVGIKRVYVVKAIADTFIQKLMDIVNGLRPGIDYGPYITKSARNEVKRRIDDAVKNGAELLTGGTIPNTKELRNGNWLYPSVLVYKDEKLELVKTETFGNVLPIRIVEDADDAIKHANNTVYGLSNAVFSKDVKHAKKVAERLESGMVFINDTVIAIPGWDHWTGWKSSGFGTVESKLMQCMKKKVVSINKSGKGRAFWYPYNA